MTKNTNYLKKFNDIFGKIASENEIPQAEVEIMIDEFFLSFKGAVTDPRIPTIKLTNLGTFKPTQGSIEWHIRNCIYNLRKGRGNSEKLKAKIRYLWPIRRRLVQERLGMSTWKEWRDKYKNNEKESKGKKQKSKG